MNAAEYWILEAAVEGCPPIGWLNCADVDVIHNLWQRKVFDMLLAEGKIDQDTVNQMTSWQHSGFSVDRSVYLPKGDVAGS